MEKIYIRDKVYVPLRAVYDKQALKSKYTKHMYKEAACQRCEYKPDRPSHMCEVCPSYGGVSKLYQVREIAGAQYIGLPIGDKRNIEKNAGVDFDDFKIVDRRSAPKFAYPIKFTLTLREHQEKLAKEFLRHKYGLIEAPPRSGKTALMLYLGIKLGLRMVILANQHEFLQQFIWHIEGNEPEGIPKCTNLPELERKHKKKLFGFPKTDEDFENFQIFCMTYQQFASKTSGDARFKRLAKHIGFLAIDEVHKCGAAVFSSVVNKFYTRYRMGVTGTVERKDGRQFIYKKIIGPVVAKTTVEAMLPKVFIEETGISLSKVPSQWVYAMLRLAKNEKRNKLIVKRAIEDVKAGHGVVIPLTFKKHIFEITRMINEAYGKPIAKEFIGSGGEKGKELRRKILSDAKSGKIKVVVGTRSLIQLGLNVPAWSAIYTAIPISNKPNYKQETSRVRTPKEGKKQPIVRLFYDACMGQSVGCARNCISHLKDFEYEFSKDKTTQAALEYFEQNPGRRGRQSFDEDEDFKPSRVLNFDEGTTSLGRAGRR